MPISYTIDRTAGIIEETWTGTVSANVLARYWKQYMADPEVLRIRRTLVDLRQCRITFSGTELSELLNTIVVPKLAGRDWTSTILVADPVQFGISRQYNVYADRFSNDQTFHDRDAALKWLASGFADSK